MFEQVTHKESRFKIFWPDLTELAGAEEAIRLGYWAAFVVAALTALLAGFGVFGSSRWGLVDAGVYALLGLGIRIRSRIAAVIGLLLFTLNLVVTLRHGAGVGVITIFIFVGFLNGVRGTLAHARLRKAPTTT